MPNAWITHIKSVQSKNPGMSYKDAMIEAKKTYKPVKKRGGAVKKRPKKVSTRGSSKKGNPTQHELKRDLSRPELKRQSRPRPRKARVRKISGNVQEEKLTGEGLFKFLDKFLRSRSKLVNKYLKANADKTIVHLKIARMPVTPAIQKAINILTHGKVSKAKKNQHYSSLFHLFMYPEMNNGELHMWEKNQTVTMKAKAKLKYDKAEYKEISITPIKVGDLILKMEKMEPHLYQYSSAKFNCQQFIATALKSAGIPTSDPIYKWVTQDVSDIFTPKNKGFARFANTITDLAAVTNRIMGKGHEDCKCNIK